MLNFYIKILEHPVLWYAWDPPWAPVPWLMVTPLLTQIPVNVAAMAQALGPCSQVGDPNGIPISWLRPGPALVNWGHLVSESVGGMFLSVYFVPFK